MSLLNKEQPPPLPSSRAPEVTPSANLFTFINQDSDSDNELSCPVCMDIFIDPVDHSTCGVTLCLVCCDELKRTGQACPSCREPLNNVNPNRTIRKIIDKLKVVCNECKTKMKRGDFQRHYHHVCLISCPQQCDIKTLTRQDRDAHIREQCPETLLLCPHGCQQTVPRKSAREHDEICENVIISCVRCNALFARRDAAAHDPLCPEMMVACPHCSTQHTRRQLSAHIQSCDASPSQCSASQFCDWKGTRGDLLAHAQDCLYAKLGPYFQAQESRMSQQASRIQELEAKSEEQRDRFTKELNEARRANQQNVLAYERRLAEQDSQVSFLLSSVLKLNTQLNESKQMTSQRKVSISEFKSEQKHNIHFPLCDLTGLQLAGADLTQGYFWNSVFINMDLSGTTLARAELGNANLSGANLTGANLTGANLTGANLTGANLTGANLSNTTLSGANLSGCNLTNTTLPRDLSNVNLSNVDFKRRDLSNHNLSGCNLSGCNLTGCNLSGCNLSGCNLSGCTLTGATLFPGHCVGQSYRMRWGSGRNGDTTYNCKLEGYGDNNSVFRVIIDQHGCFGRRSDCEPSWFKT